MGLFTPAWKGNDEKLALAQVEQFFEQVQIKKLFQAAQKAPAERVRKKAAEWLGLYMSSPYRFRNEHPNIAKIWEAKAPQAENALRLLVQQGDEAVRTQVIIALAGNVQNKDYLIAALNDLNNPASINEILLHGAPYLKEAVLRMDKCNDQETLTRIATNASEVEGTRILAIKKLNDEEILAKIAAENVGAAGKTAFQRLSLQSSFFYVACNSWYFTDTDILERLTDTEKIADVAAHAEDKRMQKKALARIDDQALLLRVFMEAGYSETAFAAMKRLENMGVELPERAALETACTAIRKMILDKVDDEDILVQAALNNTDYEVRAKALRRLLDSGTVIDEHVLEQIVWREKIYDTWTAAMARIHDAEILERFAFDHPFEDVRLESVKRLLDHGAVIKERSLEQIVQKDKSNEVRLAAIAGIHDAEILERIARNNTCDDVRLAAISKLPVEPWSEDIVKIALNDTSTLGETAKRAVSLLERKEDLWSVLRCASSDVVKDKAYRQMKIKGFLDEQMITAIQDAVTLTYGIESDLEIVSLDLSLRQRIKGTGAEERVLRVLDKPLELKAIKELGKYLDRDTVETLTLVLLRSGSFAYSETGLSNDLLHEIYEIMRRYYLDPTLDNGLLDKLHVSRFGQANRHTDSIYDAESSCGGTERRHADETKYGFTFRF